ncbi:tail fiber domain-containing protein [Fulvivirga sp. M361]|uniref:tail fiber domain-containing protein n=1 Tax=Fulvivirga sp. M361 TaxID=2594266 RepID=UPI0016246DBD|nr:tail fiber domain-containing protein [Fulvivirga sp. M361]
MKTNKLLLMILCVSALSMAQAQEFWFPSAPKNPNVTTVRPGRTGVGIPTASFNAFNTGTGRYTVANRVGFLVQGSNFTDVFNIGHLLTGDFGEEKVGDVWTSVGGPGSPGISGLPLYGTRHQFDRYSVNMALTDRNIITGSPGTSGIRDAILFWDASPANNGRMYIGKTLGSGRISPDIVINPNGNVGIGTTSASSQLTIGGSIRAQGAGRFETFITVSDFASFGDDVLVNSGTVQTRSITGIFDLTFGNGTILSIGNIIPSGGRSLGASSRGWLNVFANNFVSTSDIRAKDKIKPITYGLAHIQELNPVSYQWKNSDENEIHVGLIAQEVSKVIPEIVYDPTKEIRYDSAGRALPADSDALYGIRYNELIPVMIKAIQEMSLKMEEQEKVIARLTRENTRVIDDALGQSPDTSTGSLSSLELYQNTPNPFDQSTTIRYYLPEDTQKAQLFLYDINGQQVRNIELSENGAGSMTITAGELGAGIYFYTLYADGEVSQTRKMLLTD